MRATFKGFIVKNIPELSERGKSFYEGREGELALMYSEKEFPVLSMSFLDGVELAHVHIRLDEDNSTVLFDNHFNGEITIEEI